MCVVANAFAPVRTKMRATSSSASQSAAAKESPKVATPTVAMRVRPSSRRSTGPEVAAKFFKIATPHREEQVHLGPFL